MMLQPGHGSPSSESSHAMNTQTPARSVQAPGLFKIMMEARAPLEYTASLAMAPWLSSAPRVDGHPMLVYPGLMASDFSTRPLRRLLRALGHDARGWGMGRNLGPRHGLLDQALQRLLHLHRQSGRKVSLVGWSLGGIYARELAKLAPDAVRCVVTLGTPFAGHMHASNAKRTFDWLQRRRGGPRAAMGSAPPAPVTATAVRREWRDLHVPPPLPTTSIFSRSDGVVAWQSSVQTAGPMSESIEVRASHTGLGVNPIALRALSDRLAQPEGAWLPFKPGPGTRRLYPDPHRHG